MFAFDFAFGVIKTKINRFPTEEEMRKILLAIAEVRRIRLLFHTQTYCPVYLQLALSLLLTFFLSFHCFFSSHSLSSSDFAIFLFRFCHQHKRRPSCGRKAVEGRHTMGNALSLFFLLSSYYSDASFLSYLYSLSLSLSLQVLLCTSPLLRVEREAPP